MDEQNIKKTVDFIYNNFSMLRKRILFGDADHFKTWLINHGMLNNKVSKFNFNK